MPRVKSHVPSSPSALTTSLPLFTPLPLLLPSLAKDSPQKAHQNSPLMPWQAINPWSPKLQITWDVTHFGWVGWQVCMCLISRGGVALGRAGVLFVCFKAGYFFNEVMPWQI